MITKVTFLLRNLSHEKLKNAISDAKWVTENMDKATKMLSLLETFPNTPIHQAIKSFWGTEPYRVKQYGKSKRCYSVKCVCIWEEEDKVNQPA